MDRVGISHRQQALAEWRMQLKPEAACFCLRWPAVSGKKLGATLIEISARPWAGADLRYLAAVRAA